MIRTDARSTTAAAAATIDPREMTAGDPKFTDERDRLRAQLALARDLQGLLVHEFSNPLQSASMLVELCHDDLQTRDPEGKPTQRLTRALEALERLRLLVQRAGNTRATLAGRGHEPVTWGQLLDEFEGLLAERMTRGRLGWQRQTANIDAAPIPAGPLREAVLTLLLGACDAARDARLSGATLVLAGKIRAEHDGQREHDSQREHDMGLRVGLRVAEQAHALDDALGARARALLASDDGEPNPAQPCCERDGGDWLLWSDRVVD